MINPKSHACTVCGYTWEFNKFQKLLMFMGFKKYFMCPQCQCKMEFRLLYHVVKISSRKVLNEDIWKRG